MIKVDDYNGIWVDYISNNKSITEISRERDIKKSVLIKLGLK